MSCRGCSKPLTAKSYPRCKACVAAHLAMWQPKGMDDFTTRLLTWLDVRKYRQGYTPEQAALVDDIRTEFLGVP